MAHKPTNTEFEIEQTIRGRLPQYAEGPFPSDKIRRICRQNTIDLKVSFDLHFAKIAGYAFSAGKMSQKANSELCTIASHLSRSFFECYPQFDQYRALITEESTPNLHRHVVAVEENRLDLLRLIGTIIASREQEDTVQH